MPVNSDHDEQNKDAAGKRLPDNQPDHFNGHRIVSGDLWVELQPATLYVTPPEGTNSGSWSISAPAKVKLWLWKQSESRWVDVSQDTGTSYSESNQSMPLTRSFIIEGMQRSESIRDVTITGSAGGVSDRAKLTLLELDADVDSDNDNGFSNPEMNADEERLEDDPEEPGKILAVNDGDVDADGIPDFADGYSLYEDDDFETLEGVSFIPYILDLRGVRFNEDLYIRFGYAASHPWRDTPQTPDGVIRTGSGTAQDPYVYQPGPHYMRLWTRNANDNDGRTSSEPLRDGGFYVAPNVDYTLEDLTDRRSSPQHVPDEPNVFVFWMESVRPSDNVGDHMIWAAVDPDGPGSQLWVSADVVRATAHGPLIRIDANRDGRITLDNNDRTSSGKPYRFWLNNDDDGDLQNGEQERLLGDPGFNVDSSKDDIMSSRDQEDWARLIIKPPLGYDANDSSWTLRLRLTDDDPQSGFRLRYLSPLAREEANGYLTDPSVDLLGEVVHPPLENGDSVDVPEANYWLNNNNGEIDLLFEGMTAGEGTLALEVWKGTSKVTEDLIHLKLMPVRQMFEHRTVGDSYQWGDPKTDQWLISNHAARTADSGVYNQESPETDDVIVFVHGWRMKPNERRSYAETAYKRLYWQGFQGRFYLYSWPTQWVNFDDEWYTTLWNAITDPGNFARSQEIAFHSAAGLANLLKNLNQTYGATGKISVMAHSMGNVVTSEALRILHTQQTGQIVDTYAASQSAMGADAFIGGANSQYPVEFNGYLGGSNPWFRQIDQVATKIVNLYNPDDSALNRWDINNSFKPDALLQVAGYGLPGFAADYIFYTEPTRWVRRPNGGDSVLISFAQYPYEMFSYLAHDERPPLGRLAIASEGGPVTVDVDLNQEFGFGNDHSGQFTSNIMLRREYWRALLTQFDLPVSP